MIALSIVIAKAKRSFILMPIQYRFQKKTFVNKPIAILRTMILCVDVQYEYNKAFIAGILFKDWTDAEASHSYTLQLDKIEDYEAGQFYKRELPCILALLETISETIDMIVIDGYCYLEDKTKPVWELIFTKTSREDSNYRSGQKQV